MVEKRIIRGREFHPTKAGGTITFRVPVGILPSTLSFINEIREQEGNSGLFSFLEEGIHHCQCKKQREISVPLPKDLSGEDLEKIKNNEVLMNILSSIIKSAIDPENPFPINHLTIMKKRDDDTNRGE